MQHYLPRESLFTHFSVAFGVLLVTAVLIISPEGKTLAWAAPAPTETAVAERGTPAAMQPDTGEPASRDKAIETSRGGRDGERTAATATPIALAASAVPSPRPTIVPPTITAAPTQALPTATQSPPVRTPSPAVPAASETVAPAPTAAPAPPPAHPQFHVGIQAGHWQEAELPPELASLRGQTGAEGDGWREVDINLSVANNVAALLRKDGIAVDVLPATVPVGYKADAFLAIHGDANDNTSLSGFKVARARWSKIPRQDDALVADVSAEYQGATGLLPDPGTITANMREYYAFNWMDLQHAVAPTTPSAIIELGFLTTASDRNLILQHQDRVASGIAKGIIRFLSGK